LVDRKRRALAQSAGAVRAAAVRVAGHVPTDVLPAPQGRGAVDVVDHSGAGSRDISYALLNPKLCKSFGCRGKHSQSF
jgi:hypothetical protein